MELVAGDHQSSGLLVGPFVVPIGADLPHRPGHGVVCLDVSRVKRNEARMKRIPKIACQETEVRIFRLAVAVLKNFFRRRKMRCSRSWLEVAVNTGCC